MKTFAGQNKTGTTH